MSVRLPPLALTILMATCAFGAGCVVVRQVPPPPPAPPPALATQLPAGVANGKPRLFKAGLEDGLWLWRDDHGVWRVRSTTRGKLHVFAGRVFGASSPIGWYRRGLVEFGDTVAKGPNEITFRFETSGHIDGFDFRPADDRCARFYIAVDEVAIPSRIFIGPTGLHPPSNHFVLCP